MVVLHELIADAEVVENLPPVRLLKEAALVPMHDGLDQKGTGESGVDEAHRGQCSGMVCPPAPR